MSLFLLSESTEIELIQGPLNEQDLNLFLSVKSPYTYLFRMKSDEMNDYGIFSNDIVVCRRDLAVEDGDIIIMAVNGKFLLRKFIDGREPYLLSDDKKIELAGKDIELFGVVAGIIRKGNRTVNFNKSLKSK